MLFKQSCKEHPASRQKYALLPAAYFAELFNGSYGKYGKTVTLINLIIETSWQLKMNKRTSKEFQ